MRKKSARASQKSKRGLKHMGPKIQNKWNIGTENDGNNEK